MSESTNTPTPDDEFTALTADELVDYLNSIDGNHHATKDTDIYVHAEFGSGDFIRLSSYVIGTGWSLYDGNFEDRRLRFLRDDSDLAGTHTKVNRVHAARVLERDGPTTEEADR